MPTLLDTLQKGTAYLESHGVEEARLNMQHLIAQTLQCERMQLYIDFDRSMEESQLATLRDLMVRRAKGEPLQHLLGSVEFCNHEFKSDRRALIPRPETEELVAKLLEVKSWPAGAKILDVGCGSGVIGLSLAAGIEGSEVILADISPDALDLAKENAAALGIEATFVESNLFSKVPNQPFDLIVANLPYIPDAEVPQLSREVQYDPALALAGGKIGTELMFQLIDESFNLLNDNGRLVLEYGIGQAAALKNAAESAGFETVKVGRDFAGIERFLFAVKSTESA